MIIAADVAIFPLWSKHSFFVVEKHTISVNATISVNVQLSVNRVPAETSAIHVVFFSSSRITLLCRDYSSTFVCYGGPVYDST